MTLAGADVGQTLKPEFLLAAPVGCGPGDMQPARTAPKGVVMGRSPTAGQFRHETETDPPPAYVRPPEPQATSCTFCASILYLDGQGDLTVIAEIHSSGTLRGSSGATARLPPPRVRRA